MLLIRKQHYGRKGKIWHSSFLKRIFLLNRFLMNVSTSIELPDWCPAFNLRLLYKKVQCIIVVSGRAFLLLIWAPGSGEKLGNHCPRLRLEIKLPYLTGILSVFPTKFPFEPVENARPLCRFQTYLSSTLTCSLCLGMELAHAHECSETY